jgi:very-short-patch-repair endonuclease
MCICKYCQKEFDNKQKLGGHMNFCEKNPNRQNNIENLKNARKHINNSNLHLHCQYCGKEVGNNGCLILHEKHCINNPNHILSKSQKYKLEKDSRRDINGKITPYWKGKHLSEETKQKIRKGLQHWKETHPEEFLNYSRSKSKCCENFKQYLRNNNIDFVEEYIPYPNERLYSLDISFPDEKIGIEINGSQHYDKDGNLNEASINKQKFFEDKGWKIIQIYYRWCYGVLYNNEKINSIFDLPIHNKNYVKEIYKRSYQKQQEKIKQKIIKDKKNQEIEEQRKQIIYNLINNSGIDFTKSGWSKKATEYLLNRNEMFNKGIFRIIRKYYPEFLQREDVWKRNGSTI